MKLSVIGGGLAGLATAHYALLKGWQVRVYSMGRGASWVGSGFLHPFGGTRGKLNRFGREGMSESLTLIPEHAIVTKGILRLAVTEELKNNFHELSLKEADVRWMSADEVIERNPGTAKLPGIWIDEGLVVDMKAYVQHLEQKIELFSKEVHTCEWADKVVFATGAYSEHVGKVKGQTLKIKMKNHGLTDPINAHCYVVPNAEGFLLGATFERDASDWNPDLEKAKGLLLPKLREILPAFEMGEVECVAGVRATTPDHLPLVKQLDKKHWLFTGLGSKGLLYHALYAKKLVHLVDQS